MASQKCPNCGAANTDATAAACRYCGVAFSSDMKRQRTREEEIAYEINGLCFSTLIFLIIAGVLWQIGWGKIAAVIAIAWMAVLGAYSMHLYKKFRKN
jgi:uncharacterized membrane protein YvbJ